MVLRIVCDVFFLVSLVFALAGTKGIIKMPDTFSRMQASTCVATWSSAATVALLWPTAGAVRTFSTVATPSASST